MMAHPFLRSDRLGLIHPATDVHTLGITSIEYLLKECGYKTVIADMKTCRALDTPQVRENRDILQQWIHEANITYLGISYRLDPEQGVRMVSFLVKILRERHLLIQNGGKIKGIFFAGLPGTCEKVKAEIPEITGVFKGDESPTEALAVLGIPSTVLPQGLVQGLTYDEARISFGKDLISKGDYLGFKIPDRSGYKGFGSEKDSVISRCQHAILRGQPPLFRAHAGPYLANRKEAVDLFLEWARNLALSGYLDILSIGTSQLTQSNFGEAWGEKPNGGGVPINSKEEYTAVWKDARPMLVRTYAGTRNIPALAQLYEETINIAWHALSFWWFCKLDGRGPYPLLKNLREHLKAIRYIAYTGKPFEANVSHHFAFRGADDVTCVASSVLATRTAKRLGIRYFILQTMLNTPKATWGVQDLAKARATLQLVRELEDDTFYVLLQPRAGLDYFSHEEGKAKVQLAAATALMDDIEPMDDTSPPLIHVVSYCEASRLADPAAINESIQITAQALQEYRRLRKKGDIDDMAHHPDVRIRTEELKSEVKILLKAIESSDQEPYSALGLYNAFSQGFLIAPHLWECRDQFPATVAWQTGMVHGAMKVLDEKGLPLSVSQRLVRMTAGEANKGRIIMLQETEQDEEYYP
jgi:hypothetical protein